MDQNSSQFQNLKFLLVDDNPDDRTLIKIELRNAFPDAVVRDAYSADTLAEALEKETFDVVITDYSLKWTDGIEVLKTIKDEHPDLPVIMFTGTGNETVAVRAMKAGLDDYILKTYKHYLLIPDSVRTLITQVRSRKTIEQSRAIWERTFNALSDWICILDIEGRIIQTNTRIENFTGISQKDVFGRICCSLLHGSDEPIPGCPFQKMLITHKTESFEAKRHSSGKMLNVKVEPIFDSAGELFGAVHIVTDITKQKTLENQLQQSHKMEAIGTLAGGIAHDFNNILTAIIGNANLALMEVDEDGPLREEIEEIKTAGERAASLTRQLLAFSRKEIIQPKVLDFNELLAEIEKMLGRLISEDVELLTILEPALWQVEADPGQVEQVIMNLAVNARDAMPKGGKLTIETANVDLDGNYYREHGIKEGQPGSYVMLAVSDTGIGMNEETRERIFEPFFTTKEIGKGTGLGLSTIYGIVKQNNGFIWVYSEPGQGTTFKIYLPRYMGEPEPKDKEQTPVAGLDGSETVLVVEDDNALRKLARTILKQKGYKVLEAENGEDALRISESHDGSIDLLITDVVMPKMGGRKTAERLQPLYPQMKVIYMSGYTDNAIAHHGVLEPGLYFIEKPFSPKALARKVRETLDGRTEN